MCSSVMCISINFESNLHIKQPQQTLQAARITWRMYRSPLRFKLLAHLLRRECKNGLKICLRHGISPSKASLFSTLKLRSHLHVQSCQLSSNSQIGEIVVVRDAISNYINVFNDSMFKKKIACTASDIDRELIAKFFPFVARYEAQNASHAVTAIETINMLRLAPDEAFLYYVSGACGCLGEPVQVQSALLLMDMRGYPRTTTTMTTLLEAYASIGDREGVDVTFSAMKALNLNTHVDSISLLLSKYNMNNMEPPNEDFAYYQRSVRNFSLKGDIAMTENVIADMRAYGVSPTIDTMNLLLNAYLKNRDAIGAQRTFDEIKEAGLVPNLASFNKLIGAYSSTGDVFSAEGVVQAAVEAGYEPDFEMMHHIIRAFSILGDPIGAERVLSELADFNLEVTEESLYLVMSAYANAGDVKGVDEIMSRYLSMNFQPTTRIGNTVLKALASAPGQDGFDKYYKTYKSLFGPNKLKPDALTFTVLLKACLDGGHIAIGKKEFAVLKESKLRVTPELHDMHRQLTGYEGIVNYAFNHKILWGVAAKDLSPMEMFKRSPGYGDALARMRAEGNYHDSMRHSAEIGDVNSVRAMIADMESKNYLIDIDMMNTLISAYAKIGDLTGAERVIRDMKKHRLRPNFSTMRILIRACSNHGNPSGAEKILERAMSMGMRTDLYFMTEIIRAYSTAGQPEGAEMALSALHDMDIKPNKKAMHLVMESYANIGDTESTRNVMKRSRAMGFTPTSDTMNIILKSILKSADTNAWEEILKCYSEHFGYLKFIADSDTYIVLMRACEKYKQPDNAINWFNELLSFGSPITIEIRDTFRRTLGTERYQSYLRGLHSQFRAALHEVDTVIVPISLSIRAHRVSSLSPADSSAPFKDDSEDIRETSDETFFNPAAGIAKATRVSPLSSPDAIQQPMKCVVESSLISSYPMRSLEAVRSMMIEASAGSSSSANTTAAESSSSAESSWSKICKLRTLSDTFAKKGDALGAERILKVAADWHVEPDLFMWERIILAYANKSDVVGAEKTLSRMQAAGFTATEMTMISMMSLYSEIGDPVGVEDSAMRVMAGMRSSAINSPSLVHLYVLKALVRRPSGNNWDEVKSYYCEYIESATNKQRIRMDTELMKAFKKFSQVADAINWFDCYLESEGRVSPNLLYLFQNVLGDDRFESYVRGLNIRSKNKIKNSAASSYKFDSNLLQIELMEA